MKATALPALVLAGLSLPAAPPCAQDPACLERLAGLGRLWAAVKYFHPWPAWRELDWDRALLSAVPQVMRAESPADYAAALQAMLDELGDPATRVVRHAAPSAAGELMRTTADGILIVTLHPSTLSQGPEGAARLAQAAAALAQARAVVFDLRNHGDWRDRDPAALGLAFQAAGLNHALRFVRLQAPGHRSRMHSGLPPGAPGGSALYHSAFYVRDGAVLEALPGVRPKPIVFLADESSVLPPIAAALQAAGQARIVAQGSVSDASLIERCRLELPDGVAVMLRLTELVYQDGTTGLTPDLRAPAADGAGALETALQAVRRWRPQPSPARVKLPAYAAPKPEQPYADPEYPPQQLRLLAAFRLWAAVRYFFAYRDLMGEAWDRPPADLLAGLLQAADARQYALALARMAARLHDSHAGIACRALAEYFGRAAPPVQTRMIEGLPVITRILAEGAAGGGGPAPGDVVLEVDGEPAETRRARLARYLSASTPQSLDDLVMQRWLNGPPGVALELKLRAAQGGFRRLSLPREIRTGKIPWRGGPVLAVLPGNVGYADLERLPPERVEEMFEAFRRTRAIIFDLRGYPQGTAWLIAPRLTERKAVAAALFRRPLALFPEGRTGDVRTLEAGWDFLQYLPESDAWKYRGPTLALVDERAVSQAEHAGLFLRAANGTRFVGSRTAGADGDVARLTLPGGVSFSFSGQQIRHPDGAPLQRVGLIPDVEVKPTVAGVRAGRDEVLERALQELGVRGVRLSGVGEAR